MPYNSLVNTSSGWGSGLIETRAELLPFPSDSYSLECHMAHCQTRPQDPAPGEIT